MTKEESFQYYQDCEPKDMFEVKETTISLPEPAVIFDSYVCECCGESTGSKWIGIVNGKKLCMDCCENYDRFNL